MDEYVGLRKSIRKATTALCTVISSITLYSSRKHQPSQRQRPGYRRRIRQYEEKIRSYGKIHLFMGGEVTTVILHLTNRRLLWLLVLYQNLDS